MKPLETAVAFEDYVAKLKKTGTENTDHDAMSRICHSTKEFIALLEADMNKGEKKPKTPAEYVGWEVT
jgi:hypothetical protein